MIFLQDIEWGPDGNKIPSEPSEKEKRKAEKNMKKAQLKKSKLLKKAKKFADNGNEQTFWFSTAYCREKYGDNKVDDAIVDAYKFAKLKKRHQIVKTTGKILRYPAIGIATCSLIAGLLCTSDLSNTVGRFKETAECQTLLREELDEINKAYANCEISEFEYIDRIEVLDDDSHLEQVMANSTTPKYQEATNKYQKQIETAGTIIDASCGVLGAGIALGIASACMGSAEEKKKKAIYDKYEFNVL